MGIYSEIAEELERAKKLHPNWPKDQIHAVGIVCEESGEAMRAALRHRYEGGDFEDVRTELIQTAASAIRALEAIDG